MKTWQIRWRLTIWNTAVLILILLAFASSMLVMLRVHLNEHDDAVIVEELKELLEEFGRNQTDQELVQQLEKRFAVHSHYFFQVLKNDRSVLFQSRFLTGVSLPVPETPETLRGRTFRDLELTNLGHYRLLTQATRDSLGRPLLVQVISPRANLDREFLAYLWITAALLPIAAIVACLSGYLLAKWTLAPINRMIGTAERISAETLSERLVITNQHDELGRLALTLNQMFDRLHQSIEEMRRFTADAAHELRSPLAVMRTEAEVILRNTRSVSVYQRAMTVNLEETKRLGDLVNQLLTLSRHDVGLPFEMQDDVQLDALIQDVGDRFQTFAAEKGIQLEIACNEGCVVHGDDVALSQLFFNLLDNAIKYTPTDGRVSTKSMVQDEEVRIVVEDTGPGIAPEHLPHIFERFYRTDYSRNRDFGGAGLGLAICQSIAKAHHGEILVTSTLNSGSRFTVVLPVLRRNPTLTHDEARDVQPAD
jgi:heavy metal sensor kinase